MEIQLTDTRKITSDKYQYMLCKLVNYTDKETKEKLTKWVPYLYYGNISSLLQAIPDTMLRESHASGWAECREVLTATSNMLSRVTKL